MINSKAEMVKLLGSGALGNTLPFWTDFMDWYVEAVRGGELCPLWGVQHCKVAGHPSARLDVRTGDVYWVVRDLFGSADYRISPMLHTMTRISFEGEVWDGPLGLSVLGNVDPAPGSWRRHMLKPREWKGSAARTLLRTVLNENSHDDLMILLDKYPGHVVEFTAGDSCVGTVPGRNAVVWEVRNY